MNNCSKIKYTKFRDDQSVRSRVILGKPEGLHQPPMQARVNKISKQNTKNNIILHFNQLIDEVSRILPSEATYIICNVCQQKLLQREYHLLCATDIKRQI